MTIADVSTNTGKQWSQVAKMPSRGNEHSMPAAQPLEQEEWAKNRSSCLFFTKAPLMGFLAGEDTDAE